MKVSLFLSDNISLKSLMTNIASFNFPKTFQMTLIEIEWPFLQPLFVSNVNLKNNQLNQKLILSFPRWSVNIK